MASGPTGRAWASAFLSALAIPVGSKDGTTIHNLSGKRTDGHRRKDELATGADAQGEKRVQRPNGGLTLQKRRNRETAPEGGTPRWRRLQTAGRGQSCRDRFKHMQQGLTSGTVAPQRGPQTYGHLGCSKPLGAGPHHPEQWLRGKVCEAWHGCVGGDITNDRSPETADHSI